MANPTLRSAEQKLMSFLVRAGKVDARQAEETEHCARVIDVGAEAKPVGEKLDVVRVLVVDDQRDIRLLVKRALQREPIPLEIEEAESGAEALAKIVVWRPHLIVLDLMMPGMDGFDVCRRLRAKLETALIPILPLTARADVESKSSGLLAGADDYVTKPFEGEKLRTRVRWLLDGAYRLPPPVTAARSA